MTRKSTDPCRCSRFKRVGVATLGLWLVLAVAVTPWARADDRADLATSARKTAGDPSRGRVVYESTSPIACGTCHGIDGRGETIGPDLSDIGNKYGRAHLIQSILEPSAQVVEGYRLSALDLRDGRVLTGLVVEETTSTLTLLDAERARRSVSKEEILERVVTTESAMPSGLADQMSVQDFVDLIAFLETLRSGRNPTPGERLEDAFALAPGFRAIEIASGLTGATALEVAPDGLIFVCEQTGTVRLVENDALRDEPCIRLPVACEWERGLIGITVHPQFPAVPAVFVCYVAADPYPHHRISQLTWNAKHWRLDDERILFTGDDQSRLGGSVPAGHQGGAIHFGPRDRLLYVALGEQTAGQPAQALDSLLGKMLRIRADGTIPDDNPFVATTTGKYQAIYAIGLRNPFTFAFQPETGRLFANDVGQNGWEEINEIVAGGNYGWPESEGPTNQPGRVAPIHVYPAASIAGGAFAPQTLNWPEPYPGRYFFMDFVRGWIKVLDPERPNEAPLTFATGLRRPVDLRFARNGALYVLIRDAWVVDVEFEPGTGSLWKIVRDEFGGR